jgi:hypothetical protein
MPSGRPLMNRHTTCQGAGATANISKAASAAAMSASNPTARRCGGISAITRMPMNFETM